uniref:Sulfide:quinone oxidoreductase, mitochondrial n=1 Tax=Acrobeloides nanus TaxID=290746 RepID=A0A914EN52_9BILA
MKLTARLLIEHYKLLVVGGGAGGCAIASKFVKALPKGSLAVVDPAKFHYYQPGFTLVGGGLMKKQDLTKNQSDVIPSGAVWINDGVNKFVPGKNLIVLNDGREIAYDFVVIATGLELRYDLIEGFPKALDTPGISSIYHPQYVEKTYKELQTFKGGTAIFTFPNAPIKCAGAPQKICYLSEEYFRETGIRDKTKVIYVTSLPKIFGVEKYAKELNKIVQARNIVVNNRQALKKVDTESKIATFDILDENSQPTGKEQSLQYDFLHVAPPCSPIEALRKAAAEKSPLTDEKGWVKVDPKTLQGVEYKNVFAIGDCAGTPNAKTAAAVASQFKTLRRNLDAAMNNKTLNNEYDGYASCPLVIDKKHVILAEFNPQGPLETFPWDQSKPSRLSYLMKRYLMPPLYWHGLVKGRWNGPGTYRKIFHLGMKK